MNLSGYASFAVVLILITSIAMLLARHWRWLVIALAAQYAGVFWLVALRWPLDLAVVKVVTGWMAGAILGMAMIGTPTAWKSESRFWPSGRVFRILAATLVLLVVLALGPQVKTWWPGVQDEQAWGGLILVGMGLLHLGLTMQPIRSAMGLLTILSGFEIFYAVVETSTLVASLLAVVTLGIALAGAYLTAAPVMEDFNE